ncbi:mechanosensitive ion channel family protein [Rheinheimera sp.]|uniref:mechanosensitive ion channel family protein n=1 Tax=Rheinheimera sp. TaxID=1869214 RepID=UPI002734DCE4|nr:mechanosensitive ion channel family protein [Rheinheimera sp.]MDP2714160.1 mechanosensitive ion channel family protein [Rheinheimera sp.]
MKPLLLAIMLLWLPGYGLAMQQNDAEAPIKVVNTTTDQAIAERLSAITAAIAGMELIEVSVQAGVLTLSGEVANTQLKSEAAAIASRLEGVVYVQNRLQEQLAVRSRLAPAAEKFSEMLTTTVQMLPLLLVALVALVSFWLLGGWAAKRGAWLRYIGLTELASNLGMRFVRVAISGIGILIALELLDATALVSAVLGVAGVIGIALGFAFRNIVENYLAGVLLSTRNPFAIGDFIQIDNMSGSVVRLTSRDTVLMTQDGNHLRIPNSQIITSPMTNFSRNPLRRFEFSVGVSVDLDLNTVRQLAIATLQQMPGILTDPMPRVLVQELGDSTVTVRVLAWIDQRESDFLKARSEAIRLVKAAFDDAGIEMPEPIYRIHMADKPAPQVQSATSAATAQQPGHAEPAAADVSTDNTIEQQVQAELHHSDEENLLPDSKEATRPVSD